MRNTIIVLALILGIMAIVPIAFIFYGQEDLYSTTSPDHRIRVKIYQERGFMIFDRWIYLNAWQKDNVFLKKLLWTGDLLDGEFVEVYPKHSWVSDSILKIGGSEATNIDQVQISNLSSRKIKYLLIETYTDKFILFDVKPNAIIDLGFSYHGKLSVQGEFIESGSRFSDAIRLVNNAESNGKEFLIEIRTGGVQIENPNTEVKHVGCCAVDRPSFDKEF